MSSSTSPGDSPEPLMILSLDGGDIRSLSSLLVLEKVMKNMQKSKGLPRMQKPCEVFDFIGGIGTGGIIAIMLGRFAMTIDQCVQACRKFSENISTTSEHGFELHASPSVYSARKLEAIIKQVIRESCTETKCQQQRDVEISKNDFCSHEDVLFHDDKCRPTVVLAIPKSAEDAEPMLFKTYHTSAGFSECKAWEIARATSAVAPFFTPIQLGEDEIEFISSGYGTNNPCELLVEEAKKKFPGSQEIILSIGIGLGGVIRSPRYSIASALRGMAASSSAANIRLQKRYFNTGQYFRLDVDNGLQDFTALDRYRTSKIPAYVESYHDEKEHTINEFVSTWINGAARPGQLHSNLPFHYIPFNRNPKLVGRQKVLSTLNDKLFAQPGFQQVALVGFGGMGKTQVALELAHTVKNDRPEYSVFWLPGAGMTVFDDACKELVEELRIEEANDENEKTMDEEECEGEMIRNKDPKMLVKRYLESQKAGSWLLILDDADDFDDADDLDEFGTPKEMKAPIHNFLPRSELGRILITARTDDVAWKVLGTRIDTVELDEMSLEELGAIFGRGAEALHSQPSVNDLFKELNHLPLAIAQAADCISMSNMPVPDYLEVLRTTKQHKIAFLEDRHPGDTDHCHYQRAIATTWLTAFELIQEVSQPAVRLLEFIANIDSKAIPLSILPGLRSEQQQEDAIELLLGYGFLHRRQTSDTFDMHKLMHLTTQLWYKSLKNEYAQRLDVLEHMTRIFLASDEESRHLWKQYLPHARNVLKRKAGSIDACNLAFKIGKCLLEDHYAQESIMMFEYVMRMNVQTHVEAHTEAQVASYPPLLACQHELARAFIHNGQAGKAVPLLEGVIATQKKTLAANHPSLLSSRRQLARAFRCNGQIAKAMPLLDDMSVTQERSPRPGHPSFLRFHHELAGAYVADYQYKKAASIYEYIIEMRKDPLEVDDDSLLECQRELARLYVDDGQPEKAILLLENALPTREETLDASDPSLLASQHELAKAYFASAQNEKAIRMLKRVVKVKESILQAGDHLLLAAQRELAQGYRLNGESENELQLLERAVKMREEKLPSGHPTLLSSWWDLAQAYCFNEKAEKGIPILENLVAAREKILPAEDHLLVVSQDALAHQYYKNGDIEKMVSLLEHVAEMRKEELPSIHPLRLRSQQALASAYYDIDRVSIAIRLLKNVVKLQRMSLRENDQDRMNSEALLKKWLVRSYNS